MAAIPEVPADEEERLAELRRFRILDTEPDERFDRLTTLVARILGVPIALVSLVDRDRQWFKSRVGLPATETPREISFCGHAILEDDVFVVPDATLDERFVNNPLVTGEPSIRFYAGAPLRTDAGQRVGTLCAIDSTARKLTSDERQLLRDLADVVVDELELHAAAIQLREQRDALAEARDLAERAVQHQSQLLLSVSHELRTPIHAITGLVELVSDREMDQDQRQLMDTAHRSALSLARTVDRLIEAGHLDDRLVPPSAPSGSAPDSQSTSHSLDRAHGLVLVVEDNAVNRMLAGRQLARLGYRSTMAANAEEALQVWADQRPDVVLMDWQMPEVDGLETTARIRSMEHAEGSGRVPIIAVTASAMPGDRERCLAVGMDDFLAKPVGLDELDAVLARWGPPTMPPAGHRDPQAGPSAVEAALDSLVADLGDVAAVAEIARIFLDHLPGQIAAIVDSPDPSERSSVSHRLKSSSGTLGLADLARACAEVEADPVGADRNRLPILAEEGAALVRSWMESSDTSPRSGQP